MKFITVVGARPNFVKIASFLQELEARSDTQSVLVHTGQHYDPTLSDLFFEQLSIRKPDVNLGVGSGSHAEQTARVMTGFDTVLRQHPADCVVVVGDVNSTMACAITAKKMRMKVAHIESGLRSGDMSMPEEINRLATDVISDYLFTTTAKASENLLREGIAPGRIFLVGNIMIDSLVRNKARAEQLRSFNQYGLKPGKYALVTLHRPSNVDDPVLLKNISRSLEKIHAECPVLFLAHPRTQIQLRQAGLTSSSYQLANPVGYLEMINLQMNAKFVITDSGGVQEETTVLGIPCLTFRDNTERPETTRLGTNILVGTNPARLVEECAKIIAGHIKTGQVPELWDGQTGRRIVQILCEKIKN